MLASPVAYPSSLVPERWRWLYGLNPMAGVIDGFRWALTGHGQPPGAAMAASAVGVGVVLIGGLFFFQRMETNIADRGLKDNGTPPPPGNVDGYEKKEVAGKAIRKNMKTKGLPRRARGKLGRPQTVHPRGDKKYTQSTEAIGDRGATWRI